MDLQDVRFVDGVFEDVCACFDQVEVVILDLAFSTHLGSHGEPAPDLVAEEVVELAGCTIPFFELFCLVQRLNEKLLLSLCVEPLPEFLR